MGRCALSNLMFVSGAQSAGVLGEGRGGVEDGAALVEDDAVARAARGEGGAPQEQSIPHHHARQAEHEGGDGVPVWAGRRASGQQAQAVCGDKALPGC